MNETELIQKLRDAHEKYIETIRLLVKPEKADAKVSVMVGRFEDVVKQIKNKELSESEVLEVVATIDATVADHRSLPSKICSRPCVKSIFNAYGVIVSSLTARKANFQIIERTMEVLGQMCANAVIEGFENSHNEELDKMDVRDENHKLFDGLVHFMNEVGQGVQKGSLRLSTLKEFEADLEKLGLKAPDHAN